MGGGTYLLYHQRNSAFLYIRSGDSQRHAFGHSVHADDDEMAGAPTTRNERSFYNKFRYIGREKSLA